jgi:membrane protease subunit HflC
MKKQTKYLIIIAVAFFLLIILSDALFVVTEMNQVIITQFGQPMGGAITKAGLHIKMPFIQKANFFEKRWLEWDGAANQIPTKDKKYIWVDTYARWRIEEPLTFFQRVRDERGAQSRLDDIIDGETRNIVASYDLIELVRSTNREFNITEELEFILDKEEIRKINTGREKIAEMILSKSSEITKEVGIELRDVRIKKFLSEKQKIRNKN